MQEDKSLESKQIVILAQLKIYIKTLFIIFSLEDLSIVSSKYILQFCTISGFTKILHFLT